MRPSSCHARERQWKNVRERAREGSVRPSGNGKRRAPRHREIISSIHAREADKRILVQEQEIKSESCLL